MRNAGIFPENAFGGFRESSERETRPRKSKATLGGLWEHKSIEDEYMQIAALHIKLEAYEEGEKALALLAKVADTFKPRYAKILKLNKKVSQSIDVYSDYLERNGHDLITWLELGKAYLATNAKESAALAFQNILNIEPNNREANHYYSLCQ